ncbi:putative protein pim1 [Glarea lozoyensis 74030]|uniref:RCC1-like domain-containing protein n=1 Tax=Glarea lozoyensis (strain ATCC 74030 / MF5533) TaxID=1104152 RepID=H0EVC9_GLAL7|nr:putative protein pim1 [Glarea lozoyensis 74030]
MPPKAQTTTRTSRLTKDAGVKKPIAPLKAKAAPNKAIPKAKKDDEKKAENPVVEEKESIEPAEKPAEKPKPNISRKRANSATEEVARPVKKAKSEASINTAPTQKLDVYVFGSGDSAELGLGDAKNVKRPRLNKFLDAATVGVVQIAVGGMHCVALTHDQKILTWGVNDNYALGRDTTWEAPTKDVDADDSDEEEESDLNPNESKPTAIPTEAFESGTRFAQVAATNSASFALTTDGHVYGWGTFMGNDGIFGFFKKDGEKQPKKERGQSTPALIPELKNIKSLAAGGDHILALDHKGNIWAWGAGEQGQLGHRVAERRRLEYLVPNLVGLPKNKMTYVASGSYNGFAIDNKGKVWTWGLNNYGQAGVTSGAGTDNALVQRPSKIKSLEGYAIKGIEGGSHHSIAFTEDGTTLVWGRCDDGQSGIDLDKIPEDDIIFDAREKPRILVKPTAVPGIKSVAVAAGIDNCIAVTMEGQAYSWGFSESYRTGQGTTDSIKEATLIDNTATRGKKLTFAGCGGQFSGSG